MHVPGATPTSTAASFPQRNYAIAPGGAWSRLLEVQGFGQRYIDASGDDARDGRDPRQRDLALHHVQRPEGGLGGKPGPGWGFTVTLTGQDGFSPDQARGFQSTPQASSSALRGGEQRPALHGRAQQVPKVMDAVTPAGRARPTSSTTRSTTR